MPQSGPRSRCSVWALALALSSPVFADDLEKLLALPLDPGSVALLVRETRDNRVVERLKLALVSPVAEVRGVASRVINVGSVTAVLPDVDAALSKEEDPSAAREEVYALCSQGGAAYDAPILAAARRLAPRLDRDLVRIIARVRGPAALDLYFESLHELSLGRQDRQAFFRIATRGDKDQMILAASRILGHHDSSAWQGLLTAGAEARLMRDHAVIVESLRSPDAVFRGESAWYLAGLYAENPPADASATLAALSQGETADHGSADVELRFGAELLRRVLGKQAVEDEDWIAGVPLNPDSHLDPAFPRNPLVARLTVREREAYLQRSKASFTPSTAKLSPKVREQVVRFAQDDRKNSLPDTDNGPGLYIVGGLPAGIARSPSLLGPCAPTRTQRIFSVARVQFRPDGLPRHVSLEIAPESACARPAISLFLLTAARDDAVVPGKEQRYLAIFDPESMACGERNIPSDSSGSSGEVLRIRPGVIAPRIVKRVEPAYPEKARKNKEEGASFYEGIITREGCIRDLRLLKGSTPLLDISGMDAISRWRYAPATLDGRTVDVYLTVTVTYNNLGTFSFGSRR